MTPRPLILLEFNELSPALMDRFIAAGHLPNFKRLKAESEIFVTDAGEDPPNLNPWIQWVTLHSERSFKDHGVFHLGDAARKKIPMLWDKVCAAGHTAWICGSMNISVQPGFRGWVLPDPWDAGTPAAPAEFNKYMDLVRAYVFDYASGRRPVTVGVIARFLTFMLRNGLRMRTIMRIVRQLADERINDTSWKRASILDLLQFDLFLSIYRRNRPTFSSIFFNSTAHYQHAYWRNMQPELFKIKPGAAEQRSKADAILFGYKEMDRHVGEVLERSERDGAVIAFATALSQQPCLAWDDEGGKTFYKPHQIGKLLSFAGIDPATCRAEPVMSEQFHLRFESEAAAIEAKEKLDALRLDDGRPVLASRLEGAGIFTGCSIFSDLPGGVQLRSPSSSVTFVDIFYQVESLKSGMHHRDGMFWLRTGEHKGVIHPGKLPLSSVGALLLSSMGLSGVDAPKVDGLPPTATAA